ncbi:TPA: serine/threonine protein kinase [Legionella pneumophila]|nr:serine/threonine protein kinase [Legionella pneumophila]HBC0468741.1 serine/threonine protein kinase [Legionella pneumophila]HBI2947266.1 serine/threonine protein kinase [Legionella pneumophila]HDV6634099.1 serine/threonine protein kinase [Legionella pneumophila]
MSYHINLAEQPLPEDQVILKQLIKQYLMSGSSQSALFANHPYTLNDEDGNEIEFLLSHDIYKNQRHDGITEFLILNGPKIGSGTKGVVIQSNHAMYLWDEELVIFPKENVLKVLYQNFSNAEELIKQESVNYSILSGNSTAELVNLQGGNQGFFMQKEEGYAFEELLEDIDSLQKLTFSYKMELAISFLTDLENLHNKGFVHGDLTFKNILYNERSKQLKIIDAGEMKIADDRFLAQEISIARDMVSLLFTTNEANQFKASRYWSDEPTVRLIVKPNWVEAKLNRILNSEYNCVSELKLAIEKNYNEYLNHLNPDLKRNEVAESESSCLQAYRDQMDKMQLLGEIRESKEIFLNIKDRLPKLEQYRLNVFLDYLDNISSAFKNDQTNEESARAAYDFLTAQINKLFEDNSINSKASYRTFSQEIQQFLKQISFYLRENPSAGSENIDSIFKELKKMDSRVNFMFSAESTLHKFSQYKEIMIQLLLKPFETPVAEMASASVTVSDLIEKQSDTKRRLKEMKSSANKEEQPVFSRSLMRGPS